MKGVLRSIAFAGLTALLLAGCANTYRLDNTVQSFSGLPALPPSPTYRFERLPSQLAQPGHEQLEALADPALYKAGLRRDDASPLYSVQLSARITRVLSPWADPWMDPWWGPGWRHGWGPYWGAPYARPEPPWYVREVGVIVREVASNKVVYETRAHNDGPWLDHSTALAAMFDAALQGFPNPPPGPRRVDILVGGSQVAAAPTAAASAPPPAAPAAAPQSAPAAR